ncbi:hypothetical protein [Hyphomonas sp.]|uniref:hypothetical protein n=1 Tax=Alphaproteobacteria TaxID=28211 RepID=UPI003263F842
MIETVVVPRSNSPSEPGCDAGPPAAQSADPTTITVHVPLTFKRRGGRKACVTPDGTPAIPLRPGPDSVLVKALARAYRWQHLLESGTHATIQDLAAAESISPSYAGRILRLNLLAPDIVEAILDGRTTPELSVEALVKSLPAAWEEQRRRFLSQQLLAASEVHVGE